MKCTVCGRELKGNSKFCECLTITSGLRDNYEGTGPLLPNTKEDILREISKKLDKIIWLLTPKKKRKK